MSRRSDPVFYSDEDEGWEQDRFADRYGSTDKASQRQRTKGRKSAYGRGKGSRRNRNGWDRFEGS